MISLFYYKRASWNVVGKAIQFPKKKLPSIDFLQKTFDSCVLEGQDECNFKQNVSTKDHYNQMAHFCGHDDVSLIKGELD